MADLWPEADTEQGNIGNRLVIAPDFHIVSLKLYVKNVDAAEDHRIIETKAAVYHYAHDETGKP